MLAKKWLERAEAANDAIEARVADATGALASTWNDARHALARQRAAGLRSARAFGGDMLGHARRAGTSTRDLIAERPVEALLIAGAIGFALGWLIRRSRENAATTPHAAMRKAVRPAARRRTRPARTT